MDNSVKPMVTGQSIPRPEDDYLLRGRGRYTDDVSLPGQAHAYILRSPLGHGVIRAIDVTAAARMPGVLAVYTGADLVAAGYGTLPCNVALKNRDGSALKVPDYHALAVDRVRYVGQPVAAVIAETLAQAKDGAEAVELDLDELDAVDTVEAAGRESAPQIWPEIPGNLCLDFENGDREAVNAAFAAAAHVSRLNIFNNRVVIAAMEPRAAVAAHDGTHNFADVAL